MKAMNNARFMLKTWPILYGCHMNGALHVELGHTYGAEAFFNCFDAFVATRGKPGQIYSDKGTQIIETAELIRVPKPGEWDWGEVEVAVGQGDTQWRSCPARSQWQNGLAKARV